MLKSNIIKFGYKLSKYFNALGRGNFKVVRGTKKVIEKLLLRTDRLLIFIAQRKGIKGL